MHFIVIKNLLISSVLLAILSHCQLQEPKQNHGVLFLENRSKKVIINKTNKNDVIRLFGSPHSTSFNNQNEWLYLERVITKGEYHQLGRNVLKINNVLVLSFDKYGVVNK